MNKNKVRNNKRDRIDWNEAIVDFQESNVKKRKFKMGSVNSASVTKWRLNSLFLVDFSIDTDKKDKDTIVFSKVA